MQLSCGTLLILMTVVLSSQAGETRKDGSNGFIQNSPARYYLSGPHSIPFNSSKTVACSVNEQTRMITWRIRRYPDQDLNHSEITSVFRCATQMWSNVSAVYFQQTCDIVASLIIFEKNLYDYSCYKYFGRSQTDHSSSCGLPSRIHFNGDIIWKTKRCAVSALVGDSTGEIGPVLGLSRSYEQTFQKHFQICDTAQEQEDIDKAIQRFNGIEISQSRERTLKDPHLSECPKQTTCPMPKEPHQTRDAFTNATQPQQSYQNYSEQFSPADKNSGCESTVSDRPELQTNAFNHPHSWKDSRILELLKTSEIVHMEPMREFLEKIGKKMEFYSDVHIVNLSAEILAVFKIPRLADLKFAHAEVAAYQASLYLGFPYVPPTTMRTINGKIGSLQLYVDTKVDLMVNGAYEKVIDEVPIKDQIELKTFWFIFGQWDFHLGNVLLFKDDYKKSFFISIDHSAICQRQHVKLGARAFVHVLEKKELNTNDWNESFPYDKAYVVQKYTKPSRWVIYQNSMWRQYYFFDDLRVPTINATLLLTPAPGPCYCDIITTIKKLSFASLREIFKSVQESALVSDAYFNTILERRDQIVQYCQKRCAI